MRDLSEPLYNTQQIFIPPAFPHVLKVYAKAAIRTQPYDLLTWSASYFRALSDGRSPPVKTRLEYPLIKTKGGLSPGYLKLLIKQFSDSSEVERDMLWKRWTGVCLKENELKQILCLGGLYNETNIILYKFIAISAGFLCKSLTQTMIMLCELFTDEPDGGSSAISSDLFVDLYTYLSAIDASKEQRYYNGHLKVLQQSDTVVENLDNESSDIDAWQSAIDTQIISDAEDTKNQLNKQSSIECEVDQDVESANVSSDVEKNYNTEFIMMEKNESNDNIESTEANFAFEVIAVDSVDENVSHCEEMTDESNNDIEKELSDKDNNELDQDGSSSPIVKRTVTLRVFSEDGEKIASTSAMSNPEEESPIKFLQIDPNGELFIPKKDVSVEDREAIIEKLQKTQDEKVKNMEAVMDSVENLAERARTMTQDADILSTQKSIDKINDDTSADPEKIEIDPNAKGVVNPIFKGLFDNVADKMCVVRAFNEVKPIIEQEIIIVPPIPGIGPVIDEEMVEEFLKYVRETAVDQCDMFMPRDIRHYFCPPLEKI